MFVIPSKYTPASPIFKCVDAINCFHSNEPILVIDSNSDDKSYLERLKKYPNIKISDYININYGAGALWRSFFEYPNEPFYFLLQDGMILKESFSQFLYDSNTWNLMFFNERPFAPRELAYAQQVLSQTQYEMIQNIGHTGVFGANCIYKNDIMRKFSEKGLMKALLPTDKFGSQMKERIVGICLLQDGVDIVKYSIEGDFLSKVHQVNANRLKYFQKIYVGRK